MVVNLGLGVLRMLQLDRVAITTEGLRLLGDLPALTPLPRAARAAAEDEPLLRLGAAGLALAAGPRPGSSTFCCAGPCAGTSRRPASLAGSSGPNRLAAVLAGAAASSVRLLSDTLPPELAGVLAAQVLAAVYAAVASALGVAEVRAVLAGLRRRLPARR